MSGQVGPGVAGPGPGASGVVARWPGDVATGSSERVRAAGRAGNEGPEHRPHVLMHDSRSRTAPSCIAESPGLRGFRNVFKGQPPATAPTVTTFLLSSPEFLQRTDLLAVSSCYRVGKYAARGAGDEEEEG